MRIARKNGQKISSYAMSEAEYFILAFIFEGLRNILGLFYEIVPPSFVIFCHIIFILISIWVLAFYLSRVVSLFNSMRIPLPTYIRITDKILGNQKNLIIYLLITNTSNFAALITVFSFPDLSDLMFAKMLHMIIGALIAGIPLFFLSFSTYKYLMMWQAHILNQKSRLFKTTPKAADTILINLSNLRKFIILMNIAIIVYLLWNLIIGSFSPLIARNEVTSYIIFIIMDLLLPIFLLLVSLPTAYQVYKNVQKRKWNDLIEDIEKNMAKTFGTFLNPDELEVAGVKAFDLKPIRTGTQVYEMDR